MTFEEWSNKKKKEQEQSGSVSTSTKPSFSEWSNNKKASVVDQDFINSFLSDANSFLGSAEEDYGKVAWGNASSLYESKLTTRNDLDSRAASIRAWASQNMEKLGRDAYTTITSMLNNYTNGSKSIMDSFKSANDYYTQFESEAQYNDAVKLNELYSMSTKEILDSMESGKDGGGIAYTTSGGQNITWAELYQDVMQKKVSDAEYKQLSSSDDWDEYVQKGANIENPTFDEAQGFFHIGGWHWGEKDVGNIVTFSLANKDQVRLGDMASSNPDSTVGNLYYTYMTDKEVNIYNYYLAKYGNEKAETYLDSLQGQLEDRHNNQLLIAMADLAAEHPVSASILSVWQTIGSGVEYLMDIGKYFATGELDENTMSQSVSTIRGTISANTDWMIGNWDAFDFVYNTTMSLADSMAAIGTLGSGGGVALGLSAAAQGTNDALNRGMSNGQAFMNGFASGIFEGLFESVSIGKFNALKETATTSGKQLAKNIGKQMLVNASEETLTELANIAYDFVANGDFSQWETSIRQYMQSGMSESDAKRKVALELGAQVAESAASGAFMGLGTGTAGSAINNYRGAKASKAAYGSGSSLVNETLERASEGSEARVFAEAYKAALDGGKNLSGGKLYKLSNAYETDLRSQDTTKIKAAVAERLTELGEDGDIDQLSSVIAKQVAGKKLTADEKSILKSSYAGERVVSEMNPENIASGEYTSGWAEKIGTNRINAGAYNKALHDLAMEQAGATVGEEESSATVDSTPTKEIAPEAKFSTSDDGKTVLIDTNEEVEIQGIASIENGKVKLRTNKGEVDAEKISFGTDNEALLYEAVTDMTAEAARNMIDAYDPNASVSTSDYIHGFKDAYKYGYFGFAESELAKGTFTKDLSEAQRHIAYTVGKNASEAVIKEAQKKRTEAKEKGDKTAPKKGKIFINGKEYTLGDKTGLGGIRDASVKGAAVLAESLGTNVYFYESYLNKDGKRVYRDENGNVVHAPHGKYDPQTGYIYIDLNAGKMGEGLVMYTVSHELTHFIRAWSPAKFKVFADFLLENYAKKGVSVEALVQEQIEKAAKNGRAISFDEAYEEVIADSCQAMLEDGSAIKKIAELKAKDQSLWQKIKKFLSDIVAKIKKAYAGLDPYSAEGRFVKNQLDTFEQLQSMWIDALVDAGETYSAMGDIVQADADGQSVAPMLSERTWTESEYVQAREATAKQIVKDLGVSLDTAYKYIDDINSVARLISDDRARLDYEPNLDSKATVIKPNSDYKWSVDMSTLCAKRLLFTGTFDAIQRAMPNTAFDSDDIVRIRGMMEERGYEVACGICYVESTRREIGTITADFIERYKEAQKTGKPITRLNSEGKAVELRKTKDQMQTTADASTNQFFAEKGYTPTLAELNTTDIDLVKRDHPLVYEAYLNYMNARGQAKPKLLETRAEYKGEILKHFKYKSAVTSRNNAGGLRLQSFSDFEVPHLIDMMQITMDMARVGLKSQAYTKVPNFAEAFGNTGIKINLSLIAKGTGVDSKGNLIFDDKEGINHTEAFRLRDKFSKNVGTILVGKNDAHIIAAMADPRIDYIIPFHKSSWKESLYDALGLTGYDNYESTQHEKPIDGSRSIKDFDPSEYWDFSKTGDENAQIYLEKCREDGRIPKFPQFQGYEGYWKLLIDFKMYDNDGVGSPQEVVQPIFDNAVNEKILAEYEGGHRSFPVAKDVVDDFVKEKKGEKLSDRDSEGNTLSAEQQEFFKESKVRDKKGNLLVLYHGTTANFNTFKKGDVGFHFGTKGAARGRVGFGKNVTLKEVYLNITNPIIFDEDLGSWDADWRLTKELYDKGILTQAEAESVLLTDNRQYKRTTEAANKKLAAVLLEKGYDGIAYSNTFETKKPTTSYIIFNSNQAKDIGNKAPTSDPDIRYSDRDYSYESLVSKPDMKLTTVGGNVPSNRADVVVAAKKNAAKVGKFNPKDGSVSVHVNDTGDDVVMSTGGLRHGLDRRFDVNAPVTVKAGEILQNSIRINEMTPENANAESSYVLIGAARNEKGELYIVRSVVNRFKSELVSMDVLYAINAKTEPNLSVKKGNQVGAYPQGTLSDDSFLTDSTISIAQLLEFVNRYFPDILPESVLRHFGHDARPDGKLGESVLYSDRDSYAPVFYSHMGKTIDEIKIAKMGAGGVVPYLKGRGVKDEEIKWSGIEAFLEGKKSVTKEELQEFVAGSQLQIVEQMSDKDNDEYTRWSQYKLDGGSNYRELVFQMPNSSYSNRAMRGHWGQDAEGVLVHARVQDFDTAEGKMLFVEELQSDWHNEGHEKGYSTDEYEAAVESRDKLYDEYKKLDLAFHKYVRSNEFMTDPEDVRKKKHDWLRGKVDAAYEKYLKAKTVVDSLKQKGMGDVADAPFRDTYHEYVMKRLIRMAAEEGYDIIGWTPSEIQVDRWSEDYAEGYRIEYDQEIPKFLRKYGKKWGATVGKTALELGEYTDEDFERDFRSTWENRWSDYDDVEFDSYYDDDGRFTVRATNRETGEVATSTKGNRTASNEVWSMPITDSMKQSVLHEGQPMYSDRSDSDISNRELLANALESAAANDIERNKLALYKQKISLINAEEKKLHELKAKIGELSFAKGKKDVEQIKKLQFEAKQTENRINTYDRQLLNLEASAPLKAVLDREKKMAYKKAEKRGKDALAAYREKAAADKRKLLERASESRKRGIEGRRMTEMRHKIKSITSELNDLLLKPTNKKHIKEELRKSVADALSAINMDTVGAEERVAHYNDLIARAKDPDVIEALTQSRDRIQLQGDNLQGKLTALQNAYEKIKNSEDIQLNLAYQEVILNSIKAVSEKVGNTAIRNMSLEQLEMVYDLYSMIRKTIRDANKLFKQAKFESIMQTAEAVNEEVRKVGGSRYKIPVISATAQKLWWSLLKPLVAFRTIGSDTLTGLYKNLRAGEDTFFGDVSEAQAFIEEQYKKHGFKSWDMKATKQFTAKSGKTFDLTLEQMMSLYAYSRREQAHAHIMEGGIVFEDSVIVEKNKLGIPIKYEVTTKDAFNLSEETLIDIVNSLTAEQKAFVNEMQAYLSSTMGAKGNEVSMEMLGVKLFKEEFYLPIKSSQYYLNFSNEEAGEIKLKNPAFSKETVTHANNPIVLHNFTDLWSEHINNMSMYHSFVLALEDFTRVYNYKTKTDASVETMDTKATIESAYAGATKYISNFLKSLNGGVRMETVGMAEKLTSLAKKGSVLGSWSVAIQQPSAIMRAMASINPKYFVAPPKSLNLVKHKQDWEELKKYAPIAGIKEMGRFDVGMGQDTVDWIKSNKTAMNKVEDALSIPPALMDEVTWLSIWNAVKRETLHNNPKLSPTSEQFLKLAGERFTDIVSLTQVYDSVFSRSQMMRNKSWIAKALTAFMAEPTTTLNMLYDAHIQGKRTGVKGYLKTASSTGGAVVASIVLNAALKSIIMAMRDDDEDESYAESYMEHFFGDLKDNMNPLTLIPIAKDIVSIFKGYDVERMDMALISDLKNAIDAFGSDSKTNYEKWSGLVGAISAFFGVPVKNVERDIRGLLNTMFGDSEDTTSAGLLNAIEEGWTGKEKSNGQQLYEAMLNGDDEQIERVKGRFKDQTAIDNAIRKALRENDPRVKEAAQAIIDEDYSKYTDLANEIIGEGYFSETNVVKAIKSEVDAMTDDEDKSDTADKDVSLYEMEHFFSAVVGDDFVMAQAIKEDIIRTKIANGDERDEAEESFNSSFTNKCGKEYKKGNVSYSEAVSMLVSYGGKTEEKATSKVQYWDFQMDYPEYDDLSESAVGAYYEHAAPVGIGVSTYSSYYKSKSKCKGTDSNGDGRADSGTVKAEILAVINSLPLTSAQKDALYFAEGWAASKLWEAPWR